MDATYAKAFLSRASLYEEIGNEDQALEDYTFSHLLDTLAQVPNAEMPAAGLEIAQRKAVKMAKEEIERRKKNPSEEVYSFFFFSWNSISSFLPMISLRSI